MTTSPGAASVQVGGKVWVQEEVVDPGAYEIHDGRDRVWFEESSGKTVYLPASEVLPDSPCLPAVARVLASLTERQFELVSRDIRQLGDNLARHMPNDEGAAAMTALATALEAKA